MKNAINIVKQLQDWWYYKLGKEQIGELLESEVKYDSGLQKLEGDDLIWLIEQAPPWRDIVILDCFSCEKRIALVFEGIDTCTYLRYRVSWLIELSADKKVKKILETYANVLPNQTPDPQKK